MFLLFINNHKIYFIRSHRLHV